MKARFLTLAVALALTSATPHALLAQGPLTPPGSPAPTMRSLQELWDKMDALETRAAALELQNVSIQSQNSLLRRQVTLLSALKVNFPWIVSTLDTAGQVGETSSLAFGPDGQPAIAYWDRTNGAIKLARYDGATWSFSTVPGSGQDFMPSLAFAPDGQPAVALREPMGGIFFAQFDGTAWQREPVDNAQITALSGSSARTSLAFGPDGYPAIAYAATNPVGLRVARFDGADWTVSPVDPSIGAGAWASLRFAPDGQPAVAYHDQTGGDLKYARFDGVSWVVTIVANPPPSVPIGQHCSLAFGPDGQPAISSEYVDPGSGLVFHRFNGATWPLTTVDNSAALIGTDTSLAFGPDGHPAISYYSGTDGDLRLARFNGTTWTPTIVDSAGDVGRDTSLAFGPDGQPAISYFDAANYDLKFARKGVFRIGQ